LKNKINNILAAHGINLAKEALSSEKALAGVLDMNFDEMVELELQVIVEQIRGLNQSIAKLEQTIKDRAILTAHWNGATMPRFRAWLARSDWMGIGAFARTPALAFSALVRCGGTPPPATCRRGVESRIRIAPKTSSRHHRFLISTRRREIDMRKDSGLKRPKKSRYAGPRQTSRAADKKGALPQGTHSSLAGGHFWPIRKLGLTQA
jgi:hypothetical protein